MNHQFIRLTAKSKLKIKNIYFNLCTMFIIILFMNCNGAIGQNENGWAKKNLRGNVKTISKRTYKYEEGKKGKWGMDNHAYLFKSGMMHDYDIEFDNKGNTLTEISYKTRISKNDSIRYQHFYKYNSMNQIERESEIYQNGPSETIINYEYDSKNRLIKIDKNKENKYGKGHYEYKYDSNGSLEKETFFGSEGKPRYKIEYKNNDLGLKVKAIRSTYDSRKEEWQLGDKNEFSYNDKNQLFELIKYLKDGRLTAKYQYEYDEFGNIIVDNQFKNKDELAFKVKFEFKYDDNDNWINCIVYKSVFNHDSAIYIVERNIEYRN